MFESSMDEKTGAVLVWKPRPCGASRDTAKQDSLSTDGQGEYPINPR